MLRIIVGAMACPRPGVGWHPSLPHHTGSTTSSFLPELNHYSKPHVHRLIIARRRDQLAIRRPRHVIHLLGMVTIDTEIMAGGNLPHMHRTIFITGNNILAIGRPGKRLNTTGMTTIDHRLAFREDVA